MRLQLNYARAGLGILISRWPRTIVLAHFSVGLSTTILASAPGTSSPCCVEADGARSDSGLRRVPLPANSSPANCSHVANGAVHGQNAAGEFSILRALAVFDFDLDGAELVGAVGHAGRGRGVGDEHRAFEALACRKS